MKENFRIYMAGACRGLPDEGKTWRKEAEKYFAKVNELELSCFYNVQTYDPTKYFRRDGSDSVSDRQVKNFYLKGLIKNCNMILVNLDNTNYSVGTGIELEYAKSHEIPIVGFGGSDTYEWFPDYCDVIFENQDEAMSYICDYYM